MKDKTQNSRGATVLDEKVYSTWFAINYNFQQNTRYYQSLDPVYETALLLRLGWGVSECFVGYFTLHRMPWRGEKEAVQWLQVNDPQYLSIARDCYEEGDSHKKFSLYRELVVKTIPKEMGIWTRESTGVTLRDSYSEGAVIKGLAFWCELIKE